MEEIYTIQVDEKQIFVDLMKVCCILNIEKQLGGFYKDKYFYFKVVLDKNLIQIESENLNELEKVRLSLVQAWKKRKEFVSNGSKYSVLR